MENVEAKRIIRSVKVSISEANHGKLVELGNCLDEYKRVTQEFVDKLWGLEKVPSLAPKEITDTVETWLSARMKQCAAKQASGTVRGTQDKHKDRLKRLEVLKKEGRFKQARKQQKVIDKHPISKPQLKSIQPQLDSRFVEIQLENETSFEGWVTITSIGDHKKLILPFDRNHRFNKWLKRGRLLEAIRVSKDSITFNFEVMVEPKQGGKVIGVDIGQKNVISCSSGFCSDTNKHGHNLETISERLARKKKGSKGFKREQAHRKNFIGWSINQLDLDGVGQVNREDIKYLRFRRRTSKSLSHWTYTEIFDKLDSYCEEQGVLVSKKNPTYTSQRCSNCGWTCKSNRRGKKFRCGSCGYTQDSDLNASLNIALELPVISKKQRLAQPNRKGFYWVGLGQEPVVPVVLKA
jgi:transposase